MDSEIQAAQATLTELLGAQIGDAPLSQRRGPGRPANPETTSPWTKDNWKQNPGLMVHARDKIQDTMAKHGLEADFYGARDPQMGIQTERPEHRQVILLKANGLSNKEIAEITGYSKPHISNILRQPWARSLLAECMADAAEEAYTKILAKEVLPSIEVLTDLRDDPSCPKNVRLAAADKILDRALGRPTQTVRTQQLPAATRLEDSKAEYERIEAERAKLQAELRARIGFTLGGAN